MMDDHNEIEMYDDPWYTLDNILVLLWRSIVIVTFCATLGLVVGYLVGAR